MFSVEVGSHNFLLLMLAVVLASSRFTRTFLVLLFILTNPSLSDVYKDKGIYLNHGYFRRWSHEYCDHICDKISRGKRLG